MTGHWREFAGSPGVGRRAAGRRTAYADPAGVAVLRKVNRQLEEPIGSASVDLLVRSDPDAVRCRSRRRVLSPLVERWNSTLAQAGYDLRGDLRMLTEGAAEQVLPGPRDQLGVAVDALADALAANARLRARVAELEHERDRLDRKRRKWKHRAQAALSR